MIIFGSQSRTGRPRNITLSEAATICVMKSQYGIQPLKKVHKLLTDCFSSEFHLPAYKNFVQTMNTYTPQFLLLIHLLLSMRNKTAGVIKIADSTALPVCKNLRISSHKVMKRLATRSKTTTGWFYGMKLHVVTDEHGKLLQFMFSTGTTGDRKALDKFLDILANTLLLADAGYISKKLEKKALQRHNLLLTCVKRNMKKLATPLHIFLLNKRIHVEQLFSVLKERYGLVTSLPRSEGGYLAHYIRVLFGYLFMPVVS